MTFFSDFATKWINGDNLGFYSRNTAKSAFPIVRDSGYLDVRLDSSTG